MLLGCLGLSRISEESIRLSPSCGSMGCLVVVALSTALLAISWTCFWWVYGHNL